MAKSRKLKQKRYEKNRKDADVDPSPGPEPEPRDSPPLNDLKNTQIPLQQSNKPETAANAQAKQSGIETKDELPLIATEEHTGPILDGQDVKPVEPAFPEAESIETSIKFAENLTDLKNSNDFENLYLAAAPKESPEAIPAGSLETSAIIQKPLDEISPGIQSDLNEPSDVLESLKNSTNFGSKLPLPHSEVENQTESPSGEHDSKAQTAEGEPLSDTSDQTKPFDQNRENAILVDDIEPTATLSLTDSDTGGISMNKVEEIVQTSASKESRPEQVSESSEPGPNFSNPENKTPPPLSESGSEPKVSLTHEKLALPAGWSLQKLAAELPLTANEQITCICAHDSNLYIGTSLGQILHLYLFDDADQYLLILQTSNGDAAITKILAIPDANMCFVLANKVVHSYTLPELSPCRIGKIKDAEDISLLSVGKLKSDKNKSDKVVVFTQAKLRVVQAVQTGNKLLRDINYTGAVLGLLSATGTLAHYSNICIVAKEKRYDVVDMQQARKIPLFDFNPAAIAEIDPYIVPYLAEDLESPKEEYLLSICTEAGTSMAMFVNSAGDVTRGTLTWIGRGYPQKGILIDWPYVIGIFAIKQRSPMLIFSSLESLDTICEIECQEYFEPHTAAVDLLRLLDPGSTVKVADIELLHLLSMTSCITREQVSPQKQFSLVKTVISDGHELFCLQKESELVAELQSVLAYFENLPHDPSKSLLAKNLRYFSFKSTSDKFHRSFYLVLLLLTADFETLKASFTTEHGTDLRVDPRLLMLFCVDASQVLGAFWGELFAEKVFFELRDQIPLTMVDENRQFYSWLIQEVYDHGDVYDDIVRATIRKLVITELCTDTAETLAMIDSESDVWLGQNAVNDELMAFFEQHQRYFATLHICLIKQNSDDVSQPWPTKIIDLALGLISGKLTDAEFGKIDQSTMKIGQHTFDLPDLAFQQLRDNVDSEAVYMKKLLWLLQLCPERGLVLMKSAKGSKFSSTHKVILDELLKSVKFDAKFALLKIEYSEQAFLEQAKNSVEIDFSSCGELMTDYLEYLNQDDLQVEYENLSILYTTYMVENDLKDPLWPKLTWIEFLHLHYRKGECEEFFKVYLKVYELVVLHAMYKKDFKLVTKNESDAIAFLNWIADTNIDRVSRLQKIGDYSAAEWLALCAYPPVPRSQFLLDSIGEQELKDPHFLPGEIIEANLTGLIEHYLALSDKSASKSCVMHVLTDYGSFLTLGKVLLMLPDDFPVMYMEQFLVSQIMALEHRKRDAQLKKALHKANSKFNKAVRKDFEATAKRMASRVLNEEVQKKPASLTK
ncbi:CNH domain-containing protein [Metschnikowia aff. pulcherrima]|uniref:CNH domain-containing protein n=1 Tax=Metschnikowia aff. pulcherrima TaxID=2163413 RepID=A0A4P6XPN5_9ASCO|nr:CNH domain-containing protein [Metschnikowia aff. pulcherrima]